MITNNNNILNIIYLLYILDTIHIIQFDWKFY